MTAPAKIWTAELNQTVTHSPLVVGEILLVATQPLGRTAQHSGLQAIDLASGALRWQKQFEYSMISGMQAYRLVAEEADIAVVTTSSSDPLQGEGAVLAYDQSGTEIWRWRGKEQHYAAPVVQERRVFVVAGGKTLVIINPETEGDDEEHIPLEAAASIEAPVIGDGVAYIPCRGPELLAVALSGNVCWHFKFQGSDREWLDQTPAVVGDRLYAVSSLGTVFALDVAKGRSLWQVKVGGERPLSPPLLHGDWLYVGTRDGLAALDRRNGRIRWTFATKRPISARPMILYDTLYCTDENHFLHALDLETGAEKWRYELVRRIEMPPVLAPAALLAADRGGNMVALKRPSPPAGWREPLAEPAAAAADLQQQAEALAEAGEVVKAAVLWEQLGEMARAAELYQQGAAWKEAAHLWQRLDRYGKRADALERHARQLSVGDADDEARAAAWEQAARAYAETGQKERRLRCEREVARFRRLPILALTIEPEGEMEIEAWTRVNFTLRNEGFGVARRLDVRLAGDQFQGQAARTQTIITLAPQREYTHWLDVSPQAHGSSVPMQLIIEYTDKADHFYKLERTFYLEVAEDDELPQTRPLSPPSTDSREILATIVAPDGRDLMALRNQIVKYFSKEEMLDVLFELNLREDDFSERLSSMVRELIVYLVQNGRLDKLLAICRQRRKDVTW